MTRVARRAMLLAALCLLASAATAAAQRPAESEEARRQQSGIEGEPIDSKDPQYRHAYLDLVRQLIHRKWAYPCVKDDATGHCEFYKSVQLVIEFGVLKDGRVPFVIVRKPSEFDIYDKYAVDAIRLASPFPPVPPELMARTKPESTGITVRVIFTYLIEGSIKPP